VQCVEWLETTCNRNAFGTRVCILCIVSGP